MPSWVVLTLTGVGPAVTYSAWGAPKTYGAIPGASYSVPRTFNYEVIRQATYGVRRADN